MTPDSYYWLFGSLIAGFGALLGLLGVVAVFLAECINDNWYKHTHKINVLLQNVKPLIPITSAIKNQILEEMTLGDIQRLGREVETLNVLDNNSQNSLKTLNKIITKVDIEAKNVTLAIRRVSKLLIGVISVSIILIPFGDNLFVWQYGWIAIVFIIFFALYTLLIFGTLITDIFRRQSDS